MINENHATFVEAARIFQVLSNPVRLQILTILRHAIKPLAVKEIVIQLDLPQPTVSKHLATLRNYQLVHFTKVANKVYYACDDPHVVELLDDMLNHVHHEISGLPHPRK